MKLGIMQPYFFPYIGYFQLINSVDTFVIYDNIKYTKKGWINRNRILQNGKDTVFTLPLKKDSDFLNVDKRELALNFNSTTLLNQLRGAYCRAPYFDQTFPFLELLLQYENRNLFEFLYCSINQLCYYLGITTEIIISSTIQINHSLKNQNKVLAFCEIFNADTYINASGGVSLYSKDIFQERGIKLNFVKSLPIEYKQFDNEFVPWLSIIDVLMFNPLADVKQFLNRYELI